MATTFDRNEYSFPNFQELCRVLEARIAELEKAYKECSSSSLYDDEKSNAESRLWTLRHNFTFCLHATKAIFNVMTVHIPRVATISNPGKYAAWVDEIFNSGDLALPSKFQTALKLITIATIAIDNNMLGGNPQALSNSMNVVSLDATHSCDKNASAGQVLAFLGRVESIYGGQFTRYPALSQVANTLQKSLQAQSTCSIITSSINDFLNPS